MELHLAEVAKAFGASHPLNLYPLRSISNFLYQQARYEEAVQYLVHILQVLKALEAHKMTDVTEPHFKLAYCYLHMGLLGRAAKVASQALDCARWMYRKRPHRTAGGWGSGTARFAVSFLQFLAPLWPLQGWSQGSVSQFPPFSVLPFGLASVPRPGASFLGSTSVHCSGAFVWCPLRRV